MAAALAVSAVPVNVQAAAAPKLSVSKKTVYVGDKLTLKVKNQPKGAAITWASSNKKVAQVTKKGVVKAVKVGTAKVTATVKTKAVKSAKAKTYKLSCKLTVKGTSVTVRTQTALKGALKNKKIKKITIKTSLARKFTIPKGTYSKVDLVVDAPKADVENSGVFKSITIKSIKPDTFTEKAKGNRFYIPAAAARLVVAEGAIVSDISVSNDASAGTQSVTIVVQSDANVAKVSLEEKTNAQVVAQKNASVNKVEVASKAKAEIVAEADAAVSEVAVQGKDASVAVVANGTVGKVSVQATASVAISGSAKEVPVTVAKEAAGTTVSASVTVNIEASADVKVELAAGAEGSKVKTDSASVSVEVKNGTTTKTEVTTPAGTKEVGAGQSTTVKDNTPNAADTPSTPGYTDTPSYPSNPSTPSNPNTPAETHEYASNNYQKVTKEVAYGTSVTSAQAIAVLPEKIELTDKNGTKSEVSVTWDWDAYKTDVAGTYTITGTFALPVGWTGTAPTLEASVTVQAKTTSDTPTETKHVYKRNSFGDAAKTVTVSYRTSKDDVLKDKVFESSVTLTATDNTTATVDVTWTCETYDANTAGDYVFTGTFSLPEGWEGTARELSVKVTVETAPEQPTHVYKTNSFGTEAKTVEVTCGTSKNDVLGNDVFVKSVTLTAVDNATADVDVEWACESYDAYKVGDYTFTGTFELPGDWTGTQEALSVTVKVKPAMENISVTAIAADTIGHNEDADGNSTLPQTKFNQTNAKVESAADGDGYVVTISGNLAVLISFASSNSSQGSHKWLALDIDTGLAKTESTYVTSIVDSTADSSFTEDNKESVEGYNGNDVGTAINTGDSVNTLHVLKYIKLDLLADGKELYCWIATDAEGTNKTKLTFKFVEDSDTTNTDVTYAVSAVSADKFKHNESSAESKPDTTAATKANQGAVDVAQKGYVVTITTKSGSDLYQFASSNVNQGTGVWVSLDIDLSSYFTEQQETKEGESANTIGWGKDGSTWSTITLPDPNEGADKNQAEDNHFWFDVKLGDMSDGASILRYMKIGDGDTVKIVPILVQLDDSANSVSNAKTELPVTNGGSQASE